MRAREYRTEQQNRSDAMYSIIKGHHQADPDVIERFERSPYAPVLNFDKGVVHRTKIVEVNPEFRKLVEANDGYCPCLVQKNADTKCMCKDFREQTTPGLCHCGRFERVEI